MERESFKEYSEAAIVGRKKSSMKLCFEELYISINGGRHFCRTEQPREFTVKEITFMLMSICDPIRNVYKTCTNSVVLISIILCKQNKT